MKMFYFLLFLVLVFFGEQCRGAAMPPTSPSLSPKEPFSSPAQSPGYGYTPPSSSPEGSASNLTPHHPREPKLLQPIPISIHSGPPTTSSIFDMDKASSYYSTASGLANYKEEGPEGLQHKIVLMHKKLKNFAKSCTEIKLERKKLYLISAIIDIIERAPSGSKILREKFNMESLGILDCTIMHLIILFLPISYEYLSIDMLSMLVIKGADINSKCKFEYGFNEQTVFTPLDLAVFSHKHEHDCVFSSELSSSMLKFDKEIIYLLHTRKADYSDCTQKDMDEILSSKQKPTSQPQPPSDDGKNCCGCCSIT